MYPPRIAQCVGGSQWYLACLPPMHWRNAVSLARAHRKMRTEFWEIGGTIWTDGRRPEVRIDYTPNLEEWGTHFPMSPSQTHRIHIVINLIGALEKFLEINPVSSRLKSSNRFLPNRTNLRIWCKCAFFWYHNKGLMGIFGPACNWVE